MIQEFSPELIGSWLKKELPAAEMAEVGNRLLEDDLFWKRAEPVLALWFAAPWLRSDSVSIDDMISSWNSFAMQAGIGDTIGKRQLADADALRDPRMFPTEPVLRLVVIAHLFGRLREESARSLNRESGRTSADVGVDEDRKRATTDALNELMQRLVAAGDALAEPDDVWDDDDLDLITAYLQKRRLPEQMAYVERRLEEDEAFRDFAAPLVLAWSVPVDIPLGPTPREEVSDTTDAVRELTSATDAVNTMDDVMDVMFDESDVRLILNYLSHDASPEQVGQVERRLAVDKAFCELAVPLIFASRLPTEGIDRLSQSELAKYFDDAVEGTTWQELRGAFGEGGSP